MQIPEEAAPRAPPVEGQPGAPVAGLARPAQVQAGQAEEYQRQGRRPSDRLAGIADGQPAVQLHHELEEAGAARGTEQVAAEGIGVQGLATRTAATDIDLDRRQRVGGEGQAEHLALGQLLADAGHQLVRAQRPRADGRLDAHHAGIEQTQQLVLVGQAGAGHAHQRQHQPGADTQQPVQLEKDFLDHLGSPDRYAAAAAKLDSDAARNRIALPAIAAVRNDSIREQFATNPLYPTFTRPDSGR
ncbi:hypothetical protein D3C81_1114890 [compost metagenome]